MQFKWLSLLLACGTLSEAGFNKGALNVFNHNQHQRLEEKRAIPAVEEPDLTKRSKSRFLTKASKKFVVNGTGIPDVPFDIGESYAGLLPISQSKHEKRKLYFWFFPSTNPKAGDDVVIW
jgi:carboxypeptidase D